MDYIKHTQRVIVPRLFDAILRLLFLISLIGLGATSESISAVVLDFSNTF